MHGITNVSHRISKFTDFAYVSFARNYSRYLVSRFRREADERRGVLSVCMVVRLRVKFQIAAGFALNNYFYL